MYRPKAGPRLLDRQAPGAAPGVYSRIHVTAVGATLGGLVTGVDLREPLDDETFAELDNAWREYKVLLFREQHLTARQHAELLSRWGPLTDDQLTPTADKNPIDCLVEFTRDGATPGLENGWHVDGTFRVQPTAGTMLRAIEVPAFGGDTMFADMAAAYDNLAPDVQRQVDELTATHDWSMGAYADKYADRLEYFRTILPPVVHPVVLRHPTTGRKTLFVNRFFTRCIDGLSPDDSDALLDHLCRQAEVPEYQLRFHWEPGSIAFWDNIAVQHYGVNDYFPQRRTMARATFFGAPDAWPGAVAAGMVTSSVGE
ncbi:MAG TPA: TauD/TfdA family dioxygenase [Acidimicrobiales bacterium]|nr:TauD/TfdA family dioxygenase [Acidimicrobiales bacterium]